MIMATDTDNAKIDDDATSEASSAIHNGSIVSTVPDKHGFFGGAQYTAEYVAQVPPAVVLRRERKWLVMFNHWEEYMSAHYKRLRSRCRKGIPTSVRPRAWFHLCGGHLRKLQSPNLFTTLCRKEGESRWEAEIRTDLHRQFPYHEMFADREGIGQQQLHQVLKCYSLLNKEDGYCQAQAPIAAFLLMHMPADEAFWCLVSISDSYVSGYYNKKMENIQLDGDILFGLLKRVSPSVYRHLKKQEIDPLLYMTEWFLCVFTRSLPWTTLLHFWDIFLCEGIKTVFKAALIILKYTLEPRRVMANCPTMYETLEVLRNPPAHVVEEKFLITEVLRLNLTEEDFRAEHKRQEKRKSEKAGKASAKKAK